MNTSRARTSAASSPWYRSPVALVAAVVVVAAIVAVLVTTLGGDDEVADVVTDGSSDAGAAIAPADDVAPNPAAGVTFGGEDIPESAAVGVDGDALPLFEGGADGAVGLEAPVVTAAISLASGETLRLDHGEPRVIGFLAHWCPHCQAELPDLADFLETNPLAANAEFIAVSTSLRPDQGNFPPSRWFNRDELQATVIVDDPAGTLLSSFGFGGFPSFVAIDENGVVVERLSGNIGVAGFEQLFSNFDG